MFQTYQIGISTGEPQEPVQAMTVQAENATEAVITGLEQMGIHSLESITGITIQDQEDGV